MRHCKSSSDMLVGLVIAEKTKKRSKKRPSKSKAKSEATDLSTPLSLASATPRVVAPSVKGRLCPPGSEGKESIPSLVLLQLQALDIESF